MDLFGYDPAVNLLPCDGTVNYYGPVLDPGGAQRYYEALLQHVPWKNDEVTVFGKHHITARMVAWYGDPGLAYTYSGTTTINSGKLNGVVGGSCANSAVSLTATAGNKAILGVSITDRTKQWTCASLTVNNAVRMSGPMAFGALGAVVGVSAVFWILAGVMVLGAGLARWQLRKKPV